MRPVALAAALVLPFLLPSVAPASSLVYDNGLVNVVNMPVVADDVEVRNGPGLLTTTLRVVGPGGFSSENFDDTFMDLFGFSRLEALSGADLNNAKVAARDRSVVRCEGCGISSNSSDRALSLHDDSALELISGTIGGIEALDRSRVSIAGGWVTTFDTGLTALHDSLVFVTGGQIDGANLDNQQVSITGGTFTEGGPGGGSVSLRAMQLEITGGVFDVSFLSLGGMGEVRGGLFDAGVEVGILTDSIITVFGSGFNLPDGPVAAMSGMLTGLLSDGSPIDWSFFRPNATAMLILQSVPEPPSAVLLAVALAAAAVWGRPAAAGDGRRAPAGGPARRSNRSRSAAPRDPRRCLRTGRRAGP